MYHPPEAIPCTRHSPKTTRLRCTQCETPICPQCMVQTEVGFKCPNCINNQASHLYQVTPAQFLLVFLLGVGVGFGYGYAHPIFLSLPLQIMGIPILGILLAAGLGQLVGQSIQGMLKQKRHRSFIVLMGLGFILGLILGPYQVILMGLLHFIPSLLNGAGDIMTSGTSAIFSWIDISVNLILPFLLFDGIRRSFKS